MAAITIKEDSKYRIADEDLVKIKLVGVLNKTPAFLINYVVVFMIWDFVYLKRHAIFGSLI